MLKSGGHLLLIDGTVDDGYLETEAWSHSVEKLRDPSQNHFITPLKWRHLCGHAGLRVAQRELQPFEQPDLLWYIEAADTPSENREKVLEPIRQVPDETQKLFNVNPDDERKIT